MRNSAVIHGEEEAKPVGGLVIPKFKLPPDLKERESLMIEAAQANIRKHPGPLLSDPLGRKYMSNPNEKGLVSLNVCISTSVGNFFFKRRSYQTTSFSETKKMQRILLNFIVLE